MRFAFVLLAAGALAAAATAQGTNTTAGAGIFNTRHDFRSRTWNQDPLLAKPGELCGPCHIPHVEGRPADRTNEILLWGRQMSALNYVLYTSPTIQGTSEQPSGSTRLCLSCHDGTVAMGNFHLQIDPATGTTNRISGLRQVPGRLGRGTNDFGADHPVSITYAVGVDDGLNPLTTPFGNPGGSTIADLLEGGKIQCRTCHDVHNVDVPGPGSIKLLRVRNDDPANPSALCLVCHKK